MKISCLKNSKDEKSFKLAKQFGVAVFEIDDMENVDNKISMLVKENYNTIIVSNELAGFSQDLIKKYQKSENINIIIIPK